MWSAVRDRLTEAFRKQSRQHLHRFEGVRTSQGKDVAKQRADRLTTRTEQLKVLRDFNYQLLDTLRWCVSSWRGEGLAGWPAHRGWCDVVSMWRWRNQTRSLSASGGYKLHLGVAAVSALRDLLFAASFESLLGSAVATLGFSLVVRDHRGRRLLRAAETSDGLTLDVDRVTVAPGPGFRP